MALIRRTINLDFNNVEIEEPIVVPDPIVLDLETKHSLVDSQFITYSGRRWTVPTQTLEQKITSGSWRPYCVTGRFVYGTRHHVEQLVRMIGYDKNTPGYRTTLIVAHTSGQSKLRTALDSHADIYSEQEFYDALLQATSVSGTIKNRLRTLRTNALTKEQMIANYIIPL